MNKLKKRFTIQNYNIGIVDKTVLEEGIKPNTIKWLKHPFRDRFFADPFLWYQDENSYYILAEEMCFFEEFGKIVLLTANKSSFSLEKREVIIEEPFHLSFPFCEENSEFITPEAAKSEKCTQYRVCKKTHKILETTVIADSGIIDPIFIKNNSEEYIFGSKPCSPKDKLFLYSKDQNGKFNIVSEQPLCSGLESSRNAGALFEYAGKLFRPVQICTKRYGEASALMEVLNLSKEDYTEKEVLRVCALENPPFHETLHTFNVYDDVIFVDGSIDLFSVRNIYYRFKKVLKRIFKF